LPRAQAPSGGPRRKKPHETPEQTAQRIRQEHTPDPSQHTEHAYGFQHELAQVARDQRRELTQYEKVFSVKQAIKDRAAQVPMAQVQQNPTAVASVVANPSVATADIPNTLNAYNVAARFVAINTTFAGQPNALAPYVANLVRIQDPQLRADAANFLRTIKQLPMDQQVALLAVLQNPNGTLMAEQPHTAEIIKALAGIEVSTDAMDAFLGGGTHAAGQVLSAPIGAAGWLAGHTFPGGKEFVQGAAEYGMYGLRVAEGAAGFAISTAFGNTDPYKSTLEQIGDYVPSFDEFKSGAHSGFTKALFELSGSDPENQPGLAATTDLVGDIIAGETIGGQARAIRELRATPYEYGGKYSGAEWVDKLGGRRLIKDVEAAVEKYPKEQAAEIIRQRAGVPKPFADELARAAGDPAEVRRVIEETIDEFGLNPQRIAEAEAELRAVRERMAVGEESPGKVYYRGKTTEEVVAPEKLSSAEGERVAGRWFTDSADVAGSEYAVKGTTSEIFERRAQGEAYAPNVQRVRINLEKPYDYNGSVSLEEATKIAESAERLGETQVAQNIMAGVQSATGDFSAAQLLDGMWSDMANDGARVTRLLKDAGYDGFKEITTRASRGVHGDVAPHQVVVPFDEASIKPEMAKSLSAEEMMSLRSSELELVQRLRDLNNREPVTRFPKVKTSRAILRDAPVSTTERILNGLYGPLRKAGLDLVKLGDDLSRRGNVLYNPFHGDKPYDWATRNADLLRKYLDLAKVPRDIGRELITKMADIKTPEEFFNWRKEISRVMEDSLNKTGFLGRAGAVDKQVLAAITRFSERDIVERNAMGYRTVRYEAADGSIIEKTQPGLADDAGIPHPTQSNEFAGHLPMPDPAMVQDAASTIKYWDKKIRETPKLAGIYGAARAPFVLTHFALLRLPMLVIKPALLASRMIPIGIKTSIDEGLRNLALGLKPFDLFGRKNLDYLPGGTIIGKDPSLVDLLPEQNPNALGSLIEGFIDENETRLRPVPTRGIDPWQNEKDANYIVDGLHDKIVHMHSAPEVRMIAERGAEATLRYAEANPKTEVGQIINDLIKPKYEELGKTLDDWARDKELEIEQTVAGNPELRKAIAYGRWEHPTASLTTGESMEIAFREEELRINAAERELAIERGDDLRVNMLRERADEIEAKIERLRKRPQTTNKIDLADKNEFAGQLLQDWREQNYKPELEQVYVRDRVAKRADEKPVGFAAKTDDYLRKANQRLYKLFRPVGKADLYLARGSTFYQLLEKNYKELERAGVAPARAFEIAQYKAAFETSDLHYDLAARSSFDRSTKELFWFAPVVREQLYTWLVKIPSSQYWPVGIAIKLAEAHSIVNTLKQMGWVRQDEYGQLVGRIPGMSSFLGRLSGLNEEFRLDGLNPVTPGGTATIPTLAPGAETIFSFGKRIPGPQQQFVEYLNRVLTFDGGRSGEAYLPRAMIALAEAFGLHLPAYDQLNPTQWRNAQAYGDAKSAQMALAVLAKEGIMPPGPGASEVEMDKFRTALETQMTNTSTALKFIHLVSQTVSPMTIADSSPAADAFYAWKQKNGIDYEKLGKDEYYARIDEYLQKHPKAWPFTIGVWAEADHPPLLPADAPFTDKINAGDFVPLDQDRYITKALAISGLVAEESRLRHELRAIKAGTASEQLYNHYKVKEIYAEHALRMQQWLTANPDIEEYLNQSDRFSTNEKMLLKLSGLIKAKIADGTLPENSDVKAVQGIIAQAMQDIDFGPADDPQGATINWWYKNVSDPYWKKADKLYETMDQAFAAGDDATAFATMNQLRKLNNQYGPVTHDGQKLPSPEEYSFFGKSPADQRASLAKWGARTPVGLTDFQMEQVGIPDFKGRDELLQAMRKYDDAYYKKLGSTTSTTLKDQYEQQRVNDLHRMARQYGQKGEQIVSLHLARPIQRLSASGYGNDNKIWNAMVAKANAISRGALAAGVSPGYYAYASYPLLQKKVDFERDIERWRAQDRDFDRLWRTVEKGYAYGDPQTRVPVYEIVLFGHSSRYPVPSSLTSAVYGK